MLERVGMSQDERDSVLDGIKFPISLDALQTLVAPFGITHDSLIDRMGGIP
ncbi:MAG TPA: hypothetical protein VJ831_11685 [Jatrophihabitantaceae bacterium]|nr:hypothetical protein [Jatrophihabitantaceae bacterium]